MAGLVGGAGDERDRQSICRDRFEHVHPRDADGTGFDEHAAVRCPDLMAVDELSGCEVLVQPEMIDRLEFQLLPRSLEDALSFLRLSKT